MLSYRIQTQEELLALVDMIGFLPFFKNSIEGFSIEEMCPPSLWFAPDADGPWEWKGPVIRSGECFYGKFFGGKAGFISRRWLPDFANYRRDGYDFDARFDDELASHKDKNLFDTIEQNGKILSQDLKELCNYRKGGNKGFETVITRLQMQTYVCVADFVYKKDKNGKPYGWGIAQYTTPETIFGYDYVRSAYKRDPVESKDRILEHFQKLHPKIDPKKIVKFIQ